MLCSSCSFLSTPVTHLIYTTPVSLFKLYSFLCSSSSCPSFSARILPVSLSIYNSYALRKMFHNTLTIGVLRFDLITRTKKMIRLLVVSVLVFLTIATYTDAAAWHTPGKHSGCHEKLCWTTCALGWCYTTPKGFGTQSGVYIPCEDDRPCDFTLNCAGACSV